MEVDFLSLEGEVIDDFPNLKSDRSRCRPFDSFGFLAFTGSEVLLLDVSLLESVGTSSPGLKNESKQKLIGERGIARVRESVSESS